MPRVEFWPLHVQICTHMDIHTHGYACACRGIQRVDLKEVVDGDDGCGVCDD